MYAQTASHGHARRGSSMSTVTVNRDPDMADAQSDEDGALSRTTSNYRYVEEISTHVPEGVIFAIGIITS